MENISLATSSTIFPVKTGKIRVARNARVVSPLIKIHNEVTLHSSLFKHIIYIVPEKESVTRYKITIGIQNRKVPIKMYVDSMEESAKVVKRLRDYNKKFSAVGNAKHVEQVEHMEHEHDAEIKNAIDVPLNNDSDSDSDSDLDN